MKKTEIEDKHALPVLNAREKIYGDFALIAEVTNNLRTAFITGRDRKPNSSHFSSEMKLAVDQILLKLARIACGDSSYIDNWKDIAGYATLVQEELERNF